MDFETILLEIGTGVARLTLNRPDRLNSFTLEMHDEVSRGLEEAARIWAIALLRREAMASIWENRLRNATIR